MSLEYEVGVQSMFSGLEAYIMLLDQIRILRIRGRNPDVDWEKMKEAFKVKEVEIDGKKELISTGHETYSLEKWSQISDAVMNPLPRRGQRSPKTLNQPYSK